MYHQTLGSTILEVSWDFFANAILPQVPADKLRAICRTANASRTSIQAVDSHWGVFPKSRSTSHQDADSNSDVPLGNDPGPLTMLSKISEVWEEVITIAKLELNKEPTSRIQADPVEKTANGSAFQPDFVTTSVLSRGAGAGPGWEIAIPLDKRGGEQEPPVNVISLCEPGPSLPPPDTQALPTSSPTSGDRSHEERTTGIERESNIVPLARDAADATSVWEYKPTRTFRDVNENVSRVINDASHILSHDPCRRHVFGVTIEATYARVWLFSRSAVMVSKVFDFVSTHRDRLIHLLVSLAFASDAEIGFDPTIRRALEWREDGYVLIHDILVNDRWYRVTKWLATYRARTVVGKATRVSQVRLCPEEVKNDDEKDQVFVVKDVWMGEKDRSEKEILEDICGRVNKVHVIPEFDPEFREQYFVDILVDEVVLVDGRPDTFSESFGGEPFPGDYSIFGPKEQDGSFESSMKSQSDSANALELGDNPFKLPFEARQHRRLLFKDVGRDVETMPNHHELFTHLAHVSIGLKHLYSAGYVHRDLSTGNLLVCNGKCKITDFEYAKPYEGIDPSLLENAVEDGLKTGTPAFMPIEILDGHYLFRPQELPPQSTGVSDIIKQLKQRQAQPQERQIVRHNYLHDIESLWWIAMYGLLTTVPTGVQETAEVTKDRLDRAASIFSNRLECSKERRTLLLQRQELEVLKLPAGHDSVLLLMNAAALVLARAYHSFEAELDSYDSSKFRPIYLEMQHLFNEAASVATRETEELPGWRMREIDPKVRVSKRKQEDEREVEEVTAPKRHKLGNE